LGSESFVARVDGVDDVDDGWNPLPFRHLDASTMEMSNVNQMHGNH